MINQQTHQTVPNIRLALMPDCAAVQKYASRGQQRLKFLLLWDNWRRWFHHWSHWSRHGEEAAHLPCPCGNRSAHKIRYYCGGRRDFVLILRKLLSSNEWPEFTRFLTSWGHKWIGSTHHVWLMMWIYGVIVLCLLSIFTFRTWRFVFFSGNLGVLFNWSN